MLGEALTLHGKELRFLWILCGEHLEAIVGHWMHDKNASTKKILITLLEIERISG